MIAKMPTKYGDYDKNPNFEVLFEQWTTTRLYKYRNKKESPLTRTKNIIPGFP